MRVRHDPMLEPLVQKYERRLQPRSRAEIEAAIAEARQTWAPRIERHNYLLERKERAEAELRVLEPVVDAFDAFSQDLDWEYFRRLQLDGVLPSLPRVRAPADDDHKNDGDSEPPEEKDDDGRHER